MLSKALKGKNLLVTMSVPAKTKDNVRHGWSGAFDYAALGKTVDQLMIMSYDEHWFDGPAGPVASLAWVEQVVKCTVSRVPKEKVDNGKRKAGNFSQIIVCLPHKAGGFFVLPGDLDAYIFLQIQVSRRC